MKRAIAGTGEVFSSVGDLLRRENPARPVYCVHRNIYRDVAKSFVDAFPGRVLYAVKANDDARVLRFLNEGGIRHFDCASLAEMEAVVSACVDPTCYFMVPTRLRGAAASAQQHFGARHFMIDHLSGLAPLVDEIDASNSTIFARMAVSHNAAKQDLSSKFGAPPQDMPTLLSAIAKTGAEPAVAFNVGSSVTRPVAYEHAINMLSEVLSLLPFKVRLVDIGGGFPQHYPGFPVPPLNDFIEAVRAAAATLPLAESAELMVEPGRSLAATGLSAIVEVLLRKDDRLYLNDGMYGIFWELRFDLHDRFPARCFRDGKLLEGEEQSFQLLGPTCDSTDVLPGRVGLPTDIRPGDHIEFSCIGAYSLTGRTTFNGHYSDRIVIIDD